MKHKFLIYTLFILLPSALFAYVDFDRVHIIDEIVLYGKYGVNDEFIYIPTDQNIEFKEAEKPFKLFYYFNDSDDVERSIVEGLLSYELIFRDFDSRFLKRIERKLKQKTNNSSAFISGPIEIRDVDYSLISHQFESVISEMNYAFSPIQSISMKVNPHFVDHVITAFSNDSSVDLAVELQFQISGMSENHQAEINLSSQDKIYVILKEQYAGKDGITKANWKSDFHKMVREGTLKLPIGKDKDEYLKILTEKYFRQLTYVEKLKSFKANKKTSYLTLINIDDLSNQDVSLTIGEKSLSSKRSVVAKNIGKHFKKSTVELISKYEYDFSNNSLSVNLEFSGSISESEKATIKRCIIHYKIDSSSQNIQQEIITNFDSSYHLNIPILDLNHFDSSHTFLYKTTWEISLDQESNLLTIEDDWKEESNYLVFLAYPLLSRKFSLFNRDLLKREQMFLLNVDLDYSFQQKEMNVSKTFVQDIPELIELSVWVFDHQDITMNINLQIVDLDENISNHNFTTNKFYHFIKEKK